QTGTFVGTPSYLSPEVIEGSDLSPATDIHAWGATVAFAATGNPPYGAGAFEVIFFRILNGEINLDGVPEPLRPIVQDAVQRDPRKRPTAEELVARTEQLNLDLPWMEDEYRSSGMTGLHTVSADLPTSTPQPAPPEPEENQATAVAEPAAPDRTMVAPEGFGDDEAEEQHSGRSYDHPCDARMHPEEIRYILSGADEEGQNRVSAAYNDEAPRLRERLREQRRGEDRLSDYFSDDED